MKELLKFSSRYAARSYHREIITRKKKFNYNLRTAMYQETKTRGFVRNFIGLALAKAQNQRLC